MRKFLTSALAVVTFSGAVLAFAAPAEARDRYYRHHRGGSDKAAVAAVAGIAGLAIGAAIAGSNNDRRSYPQSYGYSTGYRYDPRDDGYYGGGYYDGGYAQPYRYAPPRVCIARDRVYDPYIGRRVTVERRYPC